MRMVQECGFFTSSMKVYFSSPNTCSYTAPAYLQQPSPKEIINKPWIINKPSSGVVPQQVLRPIYTSRNQWMRREKFLDRSSSKSATHKGSASKTNVSSLLNLRSLTSEQTLTLNAKSSYSKILQHNRFQASAYPRASGVSSSTELMAKPPQASVRRSMFLRLARRRPRIPSLASMSSEMGSMPFWLITTKVLSPPAHTWARGKSF